MKVFYLFVSKYPPGNDLRKPTAETLEQFQGKVPAELLNFWQEYGFGNYGGGLLKIIDPTDYIDTLTLWLGEQEGCLPILMTGFGTLFIYRKLSDTADDMCLLDIHNRRSGSFSTSFSDFFERIIQKTRFSSLLRLWLLGELSPFNMSKREMPLFISTCCLKWGRIIPMIQNRMICGRKPMKQIPMCLNWIMAGLWLASPFRKLWIPSCQ